MFAIVWEENRKRNCFNSRSGGEENISLSNNLACMTVRGHVAWGNGTTLNFKHNFFFASFQCSTTGGGIRMHKIDCMKR